MELPLLVPSPPVTESSDLERSLQFAKIVDLRV